MKKQTTNENNTISRSDLTNKEYHKDKNIISSSALEHALKSKAHYLIYKNTEQKQTEAMLIGSLFHCVLLEPEMFDNEFTVSEWKTRCQKLIVEQAETEKTIVTGNEMQKAGKVLDLLKGQNNYNEFFEKYIKGNIIEESIFFTDEDTGIKCKCRPDIMTQNKKIIYDIKTTNDIDSFELSIWKYDYHRQAAFYLHGIGYVAMPEKFIMLAIEKSTGCWRPFEFSQNCIDAGYLEVRKALDIIKNDTSTVYDSSTKIVDLPAWYKGD